MAVSDRRATADAARHPRGLHHRALEMVHGAGCRLIDADDDLYERDPG
jgi:hypothetical protein